MAPHRTAAVQVVGLIPGRPFHALVRDVPLADWSELLPFVQAIGDDPGDRPARQVYADQLEDLGLAKAASLRELIEHPELWFAAWWLARPDE